MISGKGSGSDDVPGGLYQRSEYNGEISTCGWNIEVHSVQSTVMGRFQHVGGI